MKHLFNFLILLSLFFVQCGAAGTRVGNPPTSTSTNAFPINLAVTSPLTSSNSSTSSVNFLTSGSPQFATSTFESITDEIDAILAGTSLTDCAVNFSEIATESNSASCYGPEVAYTGHPDGSPDQSPFPTGDLGLWTETESSSGEACAAAQLNARLNGIENQTTTALKTMASLICVANVNSLSLPSADGDSLDLSAEMQDLLTAVGVTTATISSAGITYNTPSAVNDLLSVNITTSTSLEAYSYNLSFTFTDGSGDSHDTTISLKHIPLDSTNSTYVGELTYQYDFTDSQQGNCSSADEVRAGAITYYKESSSVLSLHADAADFCGSSASPFGSNGIISPSDIYDASSNPDGWGNNWNTFLASFDPTSLAGNYAYSWQAGYHDDHARTLNVNLSLGSDSLLDGLAYFGFSSDVDNENESLIDGMICNWAGPGNNHNPKPLVQKQVIAENSLGLFESTNSLITYAPTTSCDYDGSGSFEYDSDGDGTIDTNAANAVTNNLFDLDTDNDGVVDDTNSNGVPDEIENDGYEAPPTRNDF